MALVYSHITTIDGSRLYTSDGSPIVIALRDELEITCPPDVEVATPINTSKIVTWPNPTATGGVTPYVFTVSPASGSTFPIGTTTVNVSVEDAFGDTASCSFTVTVTLMAAAGCNTTLPNGFTR